MGINFPRCQQKSTPGVDNKRGGEKGEFFKEKVYVKMGIGLVGWWMMNYGSEKSTLGEIFTKMQNLRA